MVRVALSVPRGGLSGFAVSKGSGCHVRASGDRPELFPGPCNNRSLG